MDILTGKVKAHEGDDCNISDNSTFDSVLEARLSRRSLLKGSFSAAATVFFGSTVTDVLARGASHKSLKLDFSAVPKSLEDALTVPAGYSAKVLFRLGDPLHPTVSAYQNEGRESAESFQQRAGDQHDGMIYFGMNGRGSYAPHASNRGLLCINHEAIVPMFLHAYGVSTVGAGANQRRTDQDEVLKEMFAHGVSVVEVRRSRSGFDYQIDSPFNRRITSLTDMKLSGPAGKTSYMVTAYSTDGSRTRGTINNCASGYTPWGTYLSCEENFASYFRRIEASDDPKRTAKELASLARYGVAGNGRELWATLEDAPGETLFARWNAMRLGSSEDGNDDFRNVANTFGWVVEIDPFNPESTPVKRTALGRFAHEGAWLGPVEAGKPLVWYMGCDARNEYIYKYVSDAPWDPRDAGGGLAAGDKYLDQGKLYAARFNADGSGDWLELSFGKNNITPTYLRYSFDNQADVLVNARLAADAAGATKMDRPEWGTVHPHNGEVYMSLTNTNAAARPLEATDAANPRFYNGNPNGHIIRWAEDGAQPAASRFRWDVFLFGARAAANPHINVSRLTDDNDFSSPDGLWFSNSGLLWIQTDDSAYADVSNCMMLAALPGRVGDGDKIAIVNMQGDTARVQGTYVGAELGSKLRRFLVGPKECEITGMTETPDGRAIFINIQHPGEETPPEALSQPAQYHSHWPDGGAARPRSATVVITRDDGGRIGADYA